MKLRSNIFSLLITVVLSLDSDGDSEKFRKHYGLSFHANCKDYVKTFTCMSACKSIGFQVFRMDFSCKCSCHELKTTTLLPFFKWRTNGTTRTWAKTHSPQLYHVVGTLSPPTYFDYDDRGNETTVCCSEDEVGNTTDTAGATGDGATTGGGAAGGDAAVDGGQNAETAAGEPTEAEQ